MKLAFSTIGCPNWTFTEITTSAKDLGYNGIEIRGIMGEMNAPTIKQFESDQATTLETLKKLNLSISMFTSGATLAKHTGKDNFVKQAKEYIDLASQMNVEYVRVLCTDKPYFDGGDVNLCKKQYAEVLEYADGKNVLPLMETNGMFVDSKLLASFLKEVGGGALWDVHHPYRFGGETIDQTLDNIGEYVKYVHLKDSLVENGNTRYKIMGHGDIPIEQALSGLKALGYDGYLTLEWVKRWEPDLDEPGIVFATFPNYVKRVWG